MSSIERVHKTGVTEQYSSHEREKKKDKTPSRRRASKPNDLSDDPGALAEIGIADSMLTGSINAQRKVTRMEKRETMQQRHHFSILDIRVVEGTPPRAERRIFQLLTRCSDTLKETIGIIAYLADVSISTNQIQTTSKTHCYSKEDHSLNIEEMRKKADRMSKLLGDRRTASPLKTNKLPLLRSVKQQIDAIKESRGDTTDLHEFLPDHLYHLLDHG